MHSNSPSFLAPNPLLFPVPSSITNLSLAFPSPTPVGRVDQHFVRQAPHLGFWQKLYESGEYKRWILYGVEAYGIFSIGEMLGRRHVVGYELDESR